MGKKGFTHEPGASGNYEWYTPAVVFDALGIAFDLDPASPGKDIVHWIPAAEHFTREQNGLTAPWAGRAWLNPPYGKQTGRWLERLARHGNGIALVFARTDTKWFQKYAPQADAVCFMAGRIAFVNSDEQASGYPGAGSALLAYGVGSAAAVLRAGLGWVIEPGEGRRK
jgi:hypothetical protein